jgi:hypothetical protein
LPWSFLYFVVRNLFALVWLLARPREGCQTPIRRSCVGSAAVAGPSAYLQWTRERVGVRSRLGDRCHVLTAALPRPNCWFHARADTRNR